MHFDTIAIIGVGLIGGSIGLSVQKRKLARRVVGIVRREEMLRKVVDHDAVTEATTDVEKGVAEADLVVVCTPVDHVIPLVVRVAKACGPRTIITDAGSTKAAIVAGSEQALAAGVGAWASFVGSHPLAGSERTGVEFAKADLFENRTAVVTPTENSKAESVATVTKFWQALGAKTLHLSPEEHDKAVAATSHLPHLVASVLAAATPVEALPLTGGGWQDTTRIAAGDAHLWQQILANNRVHTLNALARFETLLLEFRQALERNDGPRIARLLAEGKRIRDALGS